MLFFLFVRVLSIIPINQSDFPMKDDTHEGAK